VTLSTPTSAEPPPEVYSMPKATAQKIAIVCLVLAGVDIVLGQKNLAMVFAAVAIAISLGAGILAGRKNRK
jgi:hypothetical protein